MKKSTTRITIVILIGIIGIVAYYTYLTNRRREQQQEVVVLSEVQLTLSKDLQKDYPLTPREVVKYYNEILNCFYNEETTEEEIEDLGNKARELYDAELLEQNELGTYQIVLQSEIRKFKENNRRIIGFAPASSINVEEFTEDGYSFARIKCGYTITEDGAKYAADQIYLLRRDENKRWKIYGWKPEGELEQKEQ